MFGAFLDDDEADEATGAGECKEVLGKDMSGLFAKDYVVDLIDCRV